MARLVADTSALVSLGVVASCDPNPLDVLLEQHTLLVPTHVRDELTETASYDDASGAAASAVLDRRDAFECRTVTLDETFPLDEGENAAVTLANDCNGTQLLCDEFNQLALIHASLIDTRLVTTPTLLASLVRAELLSADVAEDCLETISEARSWSTNSYVQRARSTLASNRE